MAVQFPCAPFIIKVSSQASMVQVYSFCKVNTQKNPTSKFDTVVFLLLWLLHCKIYLIALC